MKISKLFSALMLVGAVAFTACEKAPEPEPGPGPVDPQPKDSVVATDATVAEVVDLANALEAGASTKEYYRVKGVVSAVQTTAANLVSYGNINFTLMDATGTIGCYYINYLDNAPFTSADQILNVGDTVTVVSQLKSYVNKTTGEATPEMANGFIEAIVKYQSSGEIIDVTFEEAVTIGKGLAANASTPESYRVKGAISRVSTTKDKLLQYGNCNFNISDITGTSTESITCYYTNWLDNQPFSSVDDIPVVNDTVVVVGPIMNYNGTTVEIKSGYIESIVRGVAQPIDLTVDDDSNLDIPAGTITCAEAITLGKQLADKTASNDIYYIKGIVVENATTSSSLKDYGNMTFYMVDNLDDTERFEAYQVFGVDSTAFTSMQQIVAGNVVVLKAKLYRYGDQIETEGKGKWYVYSSTNTFVPDTTGGGGGTPELPEGTLQEINFAANPLNLSTTDTVKVATTFTFGDIEMLVDPTANKSGAQITKTLYKMYKNTTFKLTAPTGKNIKYVGITTEGGQYGADLLSADSGSIAVDANKDGVWTGQANTVTFSNTGQVRINKLLVIYE